MKLPYTLAALTAIALLTVGCQSQSTTQLPLGGVSPSTSTSNPKTPGTFVKQQYDTSGSVSIAKEDGKNYLILGQDFKTENGPDLFVVLHRSLPPQNYDAKEYIDLGKLQSISGSQKYEIPADVNPKEFKSAVIWCRKFNVTFGYAALAK
jgi:hypothetical protein